MTTEYRLLLEWVDDADEIAVEASSLSAAIAIVRGHLLEEIRPGLLRISPIQIPDQHQPERTPMTTKRISIDTDAGNFRSTSAETHTIASLHGVGIATFSTTSLEGKCPNAEIVAFEVSAIEVEETEGGEYGPYLRLRIESATGQRLQISLQRATASMLSTALGAYEMGLEAAEIEGVTL